MPKVRDLEADYLQRSSSKKAVRESTRYHKWWGHGDEKWHYLYTVLDAMLEKGIGKNVDDVFSEYCKKFASGWDSFDYKKIFWDNFRLKYYYYFKPEYYLEGKIIRKRPTTSKHRRRTITVGGYWKEVKIFKKDKPYYTHTYDKQKFVENYFRLRNWPLDKSFEVWEMSDVIEDIVSYYRTHPQLWIDEGNSNFHRIVYPEEIRYYLQGAFCKESLLVGSHVVVPGTAEWRKVKAKEKGESQRAALSRKLAEKESAKTFDYTLWYKKKTRQNKLHESEDIITRDRLGFDEYSFKGEFYHGCKRKKKSS